MAEAYWWKPFIAAWGSAGLFRKHGLPRLKSVGDSGEPLSIVVEIESGKTFAFALPISAVDNGLSGPDLVALIDDAIRRQSSSAPVRPLKYATSDEAATARSAELEDMAESVRGLMNAVHEPSRRRVTA